MEALHQPGDIVVDRYRILASLGQGGVGITYKAEDLSQSKRVAIKALSLRQMTDWKVLELFEREAKILEALHHPRIPAYLDHFQVDTSSDRRFYLVQELADGTSLAERVQQGWHADESEVRQIAVQILELLNYLHRLTPPVIHRDIKPQNIIRRDDGQVFLVDFGAVQTVYRNTLTAGGTFVGTFGYMPPEQFRGQAYFASDLYSLGATLLFLLTHRSPADLPQKRMKILFRDRVTVSAAFADWLDRLLEPMLEDRLHSAEAALEALRDRRQPVRTPTPAGLSQSLQAQLERRRPPKGSRINVHRNDRRLIVDIPPANLQRDNLVSACFAVLWNVTIGYWTLSALSVGVPLFLVFLAPAWAIGLSLLKQVAVEIGSSNHLEISPSVFQVGWSCFGFSRQSRGQTAAIALAEVDVIISARGTRSTQFVLWEQGKKHPFGTGLTEVEQEWLVNEVALFLEQLNREGKK